MFVSNCPSEYLASSFEYTNAGESYIISNNDNFEYLLESENKHLWYNFSVEELISKVKHIQSFNVDNDQKIIQSIGDILEYRKPLTHIYFANEQVVQRLTTIGHCIGFRLFPHLSELYQFYPKQKTCMVNINNTCVVNQNNTCVVNRNKDKYMKFSDWWKIKPPIDPKFSWYKKYECPLHDRNHSVNKYFITNYNRDLQDADICPILHPELLDEFTHLPPEFLLKVMQLGQQNLDGHRIEDVRKIVTVFEQLYNDAFNKYKERLSFMNQCLLEPLIDIAIIYLI